MGIESYGGNNESEQINERNNNKITSSFNGEDNIRQGYELNKTKDGASELALKQYRELQSLKEGKENNLLKESKESLDKEAMINEVRTMLYEKMGISDSLGNNNWGENFGKGLVDTLILDNYDLAIQVWETNGKIIIDGIKELFSSWENIKKVAEALGESVMGLFAGDPYELGKSIAELGLIGSGAYIGIKGVKLGIKQISKLRKSSEKVVDSGDIKKVIGDVNSKVDEIVPKQELDIEALAKRKVDIKRQIEGLEELGIPENFSKNILESGILTPFPGKSKFDLLARYTDFNKNGIDYELMIKKTIEKVPDLSKKEALLIFSYTDNFLYGKLNSFMRGDKDILKNMTKENIEATNRIILDLEQALEKMPNLEPGKEGFILRGDKWKGRKKEVGEEIELDAFTSVANNKRDAFIGDEFDNNIEISIIGKKGRIKDVSELSIAVNYGISKEELATLTDFTGKLKKLGKTTNEGIILPNSKVIVLERAQGKDMYYTRVKQTK